MQVVCFRLFQLAAAAEKKNSLKRRASVELDRLDKKQRIEELMERILMKTPDITPLTLLSQSPLKKNEQRFTGLLTYSRVPRKMNLAPGSSINNKRSKAHRQFKLEMEKAIKQWERNINAIDKDPAPILVENKVDLDLPPETFTYIGNYLAGVNVEIPDDPIVGCECENCLENKKHCCGSNAGAEFAYYKYGRVRVPPGTPIYECNRRCACAAECPNRVVQHGRKHRVSIFKTHNGRGWGVKALQKIKKGCFVMEYIGEVGIVGMLLKLKSLCSMCRVFYRLYTNNQLKLAY